MLVDTSIHSENSDVLPLLAVEVAVIKVVMGKLKSLSAGKMGHSTSEVGDMVVRLVEES